MRTTPKIALTALALLLGACEDIPTFPELAPDAEAGIEAALDQAAAQAQAVVEDSLASLRDGELPEGRARRERRRPDDRRPDDRRPEDRPIREHRAELTVALGAEAVALATQWLEEHGAEEEQKRFLQHAEELLQKAEAALDEGRDAAAVELPGAASMTALKAVVLPRGVSDEEARMIHDLASDLLRLAGEAVADDPSDAKRHLLALAERLFEQGSSQLASGVTRSVVPLWKSATISSYLIG